MTARCGCKDEGDEIVFGPCRVCSKPTPICSKSGSCEPADLISPLIAAIDLARKARQQDFTLSPPETPAELVLDDDERRGY